MILTLDHTGHAGHDDRAELADRAEHTVFGGADLADLAAPYRRELLAHCYRMLGSVHDAEDLVQETLLRAWQARDGFEGRSSLRVWLYRISTNACLRALERRERLPMPSGLSAAATEPHRLPQDAQPGSRWIEPIPDPWLEGSASGDPAAIAVSKESVRLAFVSALRHLPARQRAVLILRDVLAFSAQETAEVLGTSTAGVNSALQRARARIAAVAPSAQDAVEPTEPQSKLQLERFLRAFEQADVESLLTLLREDVVLEMPPIPSWFSGRDTVVDFLAARVLIRPGGLRMTPIEANRQPGFAAYRLLGDGLWHAQDIHVLTLTPTGVKHIRVFLDTELFDVFGLPQTLG
jgi:RNA polymerase sigma-70 factor (ECF subfamily)